MTQGQEQELEAIAQRYQRRAGAVPADRYSLLRPEVWQMWQERQRALLRVLAQRPGALADWRLAEVGCGAGGNLQEMLRFGFRPEHLQGVELLPERYAAARAVLPEAVSLYLGDASQAEIAPASQDLVLQSTVFSSILSDSVQEALAQAMWSWLKPGGAVLWYDFIVDNPRNADVRGVPIRRVKALFPEARIRWQRVTLAPPLARLVCRLHPSAYTVFNSIPWLRTHVLAVIEKSSS
ncbi:class I SAM-dependent methyltransferase [Paucibacter sp. Y2R2-4]|uniref:class I SAM-dependent methyltransferase n=1 Tax=Paucibacter sp. Y2R2-4 TaxID=2893553 RepID=UPI0021E38FCA|nr:class I SAM-dependent methyltransferase [Paucibacter sp. Y2R2-4]MCV2349745.1 class I SAM-dependent methyltransferase [Paucibacter sp. Y2R2-4]